MKQFLTLLAAVLLTATTYAQIGINNENPDASAALDITSTTGGLLVPRMTETQRDAISPAATGLMIYQTDGTPGFYYFNGNSWERYYSENEIDELLADLDARITTLELVAPSVCQNGEVVYLDANGITVKACPNGQIGDTGNGNGFTYTIVSEQQLRDYVNSNYLELNRLVTTQVTNMENLFKDAFGWNQDISSWDVSNVSNMNEMFSSAGAFNQPIGDWDVSNVTSMFRMFYQATSFNQPIGNWNTSNVTSMWGMFTNATNFNQPIGDWDVSNVTDMYAMFTNAYAFNQPIGDWDVSNVTYMQDMFERAYSFNQPIGNWDVSSVTEMWSMFKNATSYNQNLSSWSVDGVTGCGSFSYGATSWTLPQPNFTNCTP